MKKSYEKPMIYAESFASIQHIAGNCDLSKLGDGTVPLANFSGPDVCSWVYGQVTFFSAISTAVPQCTTTPDPEYFCYNGYQEGFTIFGS
jgi:hypothetical protein